MLEITETAFGAALKDTLELGAEQERERIIHLLGGHETVRQHGTGR